jgi:hypothetical protein
MNFLNFKVAIVFWGILFLKWCLKITVNPEVFLQTIPDGTWNSSMQPLLPQLIFVLLSGEIYVSFHSTSFFTLQPPDTVQEFVLLEQNYFLHVYRHHTSTSVLIWVYCVNNCPTRCNYVQSIIFLWTVVHVSGGNSIHHHEHI